MKVKAETSSGGHALVVEMADEGQMLVGHIGRAEMKIEDRHKQLEENLETVQLHSGSKQAYA